MPDEDGKYPPGEAPPFWEFRRWLDRVLFRRGQPRLTDPSDVVAPGALPICPRCVRPYEQVLQYCPHCEEPVGPYKALVYPDLIWIWGRAIWRLMHWPWVSRPVWIGMVMVAVGWLGGVFGTPLPFHEGELGWLARPMASIWLALSLIAVVAAMRVLAKAWRLWGTWGEGGRRGW